MSRGLPKIPFALQKVKQEPRFRSKKDIIEGRTENKSCSDGIEGNIENNNMSRPKNSFESCLDS